MEPTFNLDVMKDKMITMGMDMAKKMAVLAVASPHVNGTAQNAATMAANAISMVTIICAMDPISELSV